MSAVPAGMGAVAAGTSAVPSDATPAVMDDAESAALPPRRILLATEGRPIPLAAIERVAELARPGAATVRVISIARVHGSAFGMPSPGLLPTKAEWKEQHALVEKAIKRLKRRGIEADGTVIGTRKATQRICQEAALQECEAIVMAADPDRNRFVGNMMWSQEAQRVRRKARVPVYLVLEDE
jgi:nucleotide-binding universal stress UspA family protein